MRIFLDMDGVLCDFYGAVWDLFVSGAFGLTKLRPTHVGLAAWPYRCRHGDWDFFKDDPMNLTTDEVAKYMGHGFYESLEWMADGREILDYCERLSDGNVTLLTSPWRTPGCNDGKKHWVETHIPRYKDRVLIGTCKEACSFPGAYLVDDSGLNCARWAAVPNGGHAVLLPRPWNSSHALACKDTGRVLDLDGFFAGYEGGLARGKNPDTPAVVVPSVPTPQQSGR